MKSSIKEITAIVTLFGLAMLVSSCEKSGQQQVTQPTSTQETLTPGTTPQQTTQPEQTPKR